MKIISWLVALSLMGISYVAQAASGCGGQQEFNCMVATIYGEARGEPYEGMLVVGKSLKTRKLRGFVGKTICGISKQAYAPKTMPARTAKAVRAKILKAATASCASGDAGYTHFHSFKSKNAPGWARSKHLKFVGKVGGHWIFNGNKYVKANVNEDYMLTDADVIFAEDYLLNVSNEDILTLYTEGDELDTEVVLQQPVVDEERI